MSADPQVDSPERLFESFFSPGWLSANAPSGLTGSTILAYFAQSPFYSRASESVAYRLRPGWESTPGLFIIERVILPGGSGGGAPAADPDGIQPPPPGANAVTPTAGSGAASGLGGISGVGGVGGAGGVGSSAVATGTAVPVLSLYYCLLGVIYQCPDLATLLSARVETAAFHLSRAVEAVEEATRAASVAPAIGGVSAVLS